MFNGEEQRSTPASSSGTSEEKAGCEKKAPSAAYNLRLQLLDYAGNRLMVAEEVMKGIRGQANPKVAKFREGLQELELKVTQIRERTLAAQRVGSTGGKDVEQAKPSDKNPEAQEQFEKSVDGSSVLSPSVTESSSTKTQVPELEQPRRKNKVPAGAARPEQRPRQAGGRAAERAAGNRPGAGQSHGGHTQGRAEARARAKGVGEAARGRGRPAEGCPSRGPAAAGQETQRSAAVRGGRHQVRDQGQPSGRSR